MQLDVSAEQPRESAREREPQPRSTIAARDRAIDLTELVEDHILCLGRDPDASVLHGEANHALMQRHRGSNLSARGELDRIAEQICQNSYHLSPIALHLEAGARPWLHMKRHI